jgi:hypothetical protein
LVYLWLSDLVVALHLAYAAFVLFGFFAILLGSVFHWSWVRNGSFRTVHLLCIGLVALEALWGVTCPLTELENYFLNEGGKAGHERSFIGRLMDTVLFYDVPEQVFTACYTILALVAFLAYLRPHTAPKRKSAFRC